MNYRKIYDEIVIRRKRELACGYTEKHHIMPRCLGGTDDGDNIVVLTAREHFLCHWLLTKMYVGRDKMRLSSAFNSMCRMGSGQIRSSKNFARARKHFSDNHPCKDDAVRNKISSSLREYYADSHTGIFRNYVSRQCPGCGTDFDVWPSDPQIYCGVTCSRNNISDETRRKTSASIKRYIQGLTPEQRKARMEAARVADKGRAISNAKKGKKTNQKNIEIEKYGRMSDEEFDNFLIGRTPQVVSRMTNRRKLYEDSHGRNNDT